MVLLRLLAALVATLALGGCDDRFPDYRYKMTVFVGTADGEKAFSTVREVASEEYRTIQHSSGKAVKTTVRGEAVIVDLGGGASPVFALLSKPDDQDYAKYIAGAALRPERRGDELGGGDAYARWMQHMTATRGPRDLPQKRRPVSPERGMQDQWPMFVTFDDPRDPTSVRQVSPMEVGVRRITVEITDEPVTKLVEKRLPWLEGVGRVRSTLIPNPPRRSTDASPIRRISSGNFSTELF